MQTNAKNKVCSERFEEILAGFKAQDSPKGLLILVDGSKRSAKFKLIIGAWDKVTLEKRLSKTGPVAGREWRWLWDQVNYDLDELSILIGKTVSPEDMNALIGSRLVFPDGTVSNEAMKVVVKEIKDRTGL